MFSGDNGQGKTNLLEAIFVIASLRSFRTAKLADLIAFAGSSTIPPDTSEHESSQVEVAASESVSESPATATTARSAA